MMRKILSNDILAVICRLAFGGLFIYAALDKIVHPDQFARIVYNYHLLPGSLVNVFALVLPMSELLAGVLIILGIFYPGSRNYLILLMFVFLIAIGINLFRGINLECGCFSVSSKAKSVGIQLILRDLLYLAPGLVLYFSRSRRWMIDNLFLKDSD
ncbi:MAG: DoxX family membrane protein [FCB group bacterium]|nr:DoxX family membrane protein [FCB group bacterium]